VVPEPACCEAVVLKLLKVESVSHSNQALVASPLGFTLPLRVAPEEEIELAAEVDTPGGSSTGGGSTSIGYK
jgi:hypothetical protein